MKVSIGDVVTSFSPGCVLFGDKAVVNWVKEYSDGYCDFTVANQDKYGWPMFGTRGGIITNLGPQRRIYIIGSLRNPSIPQIARAIRDTMPGAEVFDDWYAAGPEADDYWKKYEQERGRSYDEALEGYAARNVYAFDKRHIDASTDVVLVLPAGKSGHLEFGYSIGQGKKGHILLEPDTDRWDVMYQFATSVQHDVDGLIKALKG